jgi:hypothetical protein
MSLLNTRLLDMRQQSDNLDKWTLRPSRYGAFDVFAMGNNEADSIISPQLLNDAAVAVGRDVEVPVFDSETVSIGSTRSVTIADSENTSQIYTLSFTTYAWGFTIVPSLFQNNEFAMQADFNRKMQKYLLQFAADVDTACLSALGTAKSQVFADLLGIYSNVGNSIQVPLANDQEILGDLTAIMNANDFYGSPFRIVGNSGVQSLVAKMSEYSQYNEANKTIQWLDKTMHYTNRLSNASGKKATGYVVNPSSVGLVFRHEREAILGTMMDDGTEWNVDTLPLLNIPVSTYFYESKGDFSSIAGAASADMTRVRKEHYGFSIEIAYVTAYNTDNTTYASPIAKFEIANS